MPSRSLMEILRYAQDDEGGQHDEGWQHDEGQDDVALPVEV